MIQDRVFTLRNRAMDLRASRAQQRFQAHHHRIPKRAG